MMDLVVQSGGRAILGIVVAIAVAFPAMAGESQRVFTDSDDVAIRGYDTVAYFTENQPVKGTNEYERVWQDAKWRFSSAENRDQFASDPERYAPRYGGFCAGGLALGVLWEVDPEAWVIIDDKLYLNYSKKDLPEFIEDAPNEIAKADANWERIGKVRSRFGQIN